jgi:hypothetical protein
MSIVEEIRDLFRDTFHTLPLLILGFLFFFGTMTSNVGILYLLIGHAILVPALSFLSDPASNIFPEGEMNIWNTLGSLSSLTIILWTYGQSLGGGNNFLLFLLMIVPYILQAFGFNKSVLFFYNPIAMARSTVYNDEDSAYLKSKSGACAMLPNTSTPRINPSTWVSHFVFLYGFIMANATAIMNEPVPVQYKSNALSENDGKSNKIAERVNNRKKRSMMVMAFTTIIFALLLAARYLYSDCEGSFMYNAIPIVITGLAGAAWFQILYVDCGIRPADILGIIQGMVSPRMADNPIVCVGA